ncbi:hypothetical protein AZI87_09100 [Bdellovibrio bacteriovorus]|uniref:Uncharacterized protein n=1 Tax=Bdellovibrio bacteriovorus TaxID=959 RepID=A0A162H018_BDEBC|nr:hypothetical protein [Bdellovibrio bacteriovorus]KYG69337.1 hypothetical protein AZI87_09100 [Bdellovibrio bacteriovorus]
MFKSQPTDTHLLIITSCLVALLGIPTFFTLTSNDPVEVVNAEVQVSPTLSQHRQPASVPQGASVSAQAALSHFTHYDLNCEKKGAGKVTVTGGYVQFQGKNCLKNLKNGEIEIINKSNGYTASIFNSGADKYQTDLIQLQNGDNEIAIRYRERSGKAVEEVVRIHSSKI